MFCMTKISKPQQIKTNDPHFVMWVKRPIEEDSGKQHRPGWPERSMLAQSRLLAMRKLSFRESGLMNQSAGTAKVEGRKASLESRGISCVVLLLLIQHKLSWGETHCVVQCALSQAGVQLVQVVHVEETLVAESECEVESRHCSEPPAEQHPLDRA